MRTAPPSTVRPTQSDNSDVPLDVRGLVLTAIRRQSLQLLDAMGLTMPPLDEIHEMTAEAVGTDVADLTDRQRAYGFAAAALCAASDAGVLQPDAQLAADAADAARRGVADVRRARGEVTDWLEQAGYISADEATAHRILAGLAVLDEQYHDLAAKLDRFVATLDRVIAQTH